MQQDYTQLFGVPVKDSRSEAQLYSEAIGQIPLKFWHLVTELEIGEPDSTGKADKDGHIRLPPTPGNGELWHEVGHLVGWHDHESLLTAFTNRFWPHGKAHGKPSSPYGGRQGANEDLAETFRCMWRGDRPTDRINWVRQQARYILTTL